MAQQPEIEQAPLVVHTQPVIDLDDEQFFGFCRLNRDLRIERNADKDIIIMAPEAGSSGRASSKLTAIVEAWSERDGTGEVFGSSTGFRLPNGAIRAPDIAWVRHEQLRSLSDEQWERFLPLCPDFVLELRSPSDSLSALHRKMEEYRENGTQLGWLLDPPNRQVHVYGAGIGRQTRDDPTELSGEPVLRGFVLDVRLVWAAMHRPGK
jgi:Uma2 family endonuclease